jgi:hypothetical protein
MVTVQGFRFQTDVPLSEAMLVWTRGEKVGVVPHPDRAGYSDDFRSSAGACWSTWRAMDDVGRRLQLMIEAWHISTFHEVPAAAVHEALLCIPEYRDMLATDCLPEEWQHER